MTLGLLEVLSGPNSNLAFPLPISRTLSILNSFLTNSSFIATDLQDALLHTPNSSGIYLDSYFTAANITYILADCACNPSQAVLATIDLFKDNSGLVGLLGPTCSVGALTSNLIASYYTVPQISYTASAVSLSNQQTFPYFFRVVTNDAYRLSVAVAMMQAYGWRHVACIFSSDSYGVSAYQNLQTQAALAGIRLVSPQTFPSGASVSGITTQVTALRDSGANIFLLWATLTDCRTVLLAAQQLGLTGPNARSYMQNNGQYVWIIPPSCITNYTAANSTVQSALLGTITMVNTIADKSAPLYRKFNTQYEQLYGNGTSASLDYSVYCAFDAVLSFVYAFAYTMSQLLALPSPSTGPNVRSALLNNVSFVGASGRVSFGTAAYVNSTFTVYAFTPMQAVTSDLSGPIGDTSTSTVTLQPVGNSTILAYNTINNVPIAAYANNSDPTPFYSSNDQQGAIAAPVDGYSAPDYSGSDDGGSTDIGNVSRNAFIGIVCGTIGGFCLVMLVVWLLLYSWRMRMKRIEDELNNSRNAATEGKQRAQSSNKAKSQFLANMSHEIRTPMNGVHGFARLLAMSTLTGEQQEYVNAILVSTDNLLSVINDILLFSKAETDKLELDVRPMNLVATLESAVTTVYKPQLHDSMEVIVYIDISVPPDVTGDATFVSQLVSNLMSNALKFSQRVRLDSPTNSGGGGGGVGGMGYGVVNGEYKRKRREDTVVLIAQSYNGRLHVYPLQSFPIVEGVYVVDVRGEWSGSELNGPDANVSEGGPVPRPVDKSLALLTEKARRREQRQREKAERRRVLQERKRQFTDAERAATAERARERLERSKKSKSDMDVSSHSDGASSDTPDQAPSPLTVGVIGVGDLRMGAGMGVGGDELAQQASKSVRSQSVSSSPSSSVQSARALAITAPFATPLPAINASSSLISTLQTQRSTPSIHLPSHPPSSSTPFVLQLSVEDSAIGISADMMPRLFGAFTQADASVTRLYQGSGLGLAISAKLAQLMGGGIGCISQVGIGSRFTAVMQLDPAADGGHGGTSSGLVLQRSLGSIGGLGKSSSQPSTTPSAGKRMMEAVGLSGPSPSPRTANTNSLSVTNEGVQQHWSKQNFLSVHRASAAGHLSSSGGKLGTGSGGKEGGGVGLMMSSKGRLDHARDRMRLQHRRVLLEAAQQAAASQLCLAAYYNLSTIPPLLVPALPAALCVLVVTENLDLLHYQLSQLVGWGCEAFGCRRKEDALTFMQRVYDNQEKAGLGLGGFSAALEERRRVVRRHLSDADVLNAPLVVDVVLADYRWTREEDDRDESALRHAEEDEEQRETERAAAAARQHQLLNNHSSSTTLQPPPLSNGYDLCCALHHIHHLHTHRHVGSRPSQSFSHSTSSPQMPLRQLQLPQHQSSAQAHGGGGIGLGVGADDAVDRKSVTLTGGSATRSNDSSGSSGSTSFSLVLLIATRDSHELDAALAAPNSTSSSTVLRARLLKPILPSKLMMLLRSIAESPTQPPSGASSQISNSHSHFQHEPYNHNHNDDPTTATTATTASNPPLSNNSALTLPTQSGSAPNASPPGTTSLLATRFPLRMLLAEDNLVNQRLFCRTMERFGYTVDVAVNGREALECIKRRYAELSSDGVAGAYDVLFCDEQMPEMSGPETAYHIFFDWKEPPLTAAGTPTGSSAYGAMPLLPDVGGLSRIHSESLPPLPTLRTELLPLVAPGVRRGVRPRVIAVSANSDRRDMENWNGMADDALAKPLGIDAVRACVTKWGMWAQRQRLATTVAEE